jgi:hypothetical protein
MHVRLVTHRHTHTGKLLPLFPTPCAEQTGSVVCARRRLPAKSTPLRYRDLGSLWLLTSVAWGHSLSYIIQLHVHGF